MQQQISIRQFTIIVIIVIIGDSILYIPSYLAYDAKQDAWLASCTATALMFAFGLLFNAVAKRYPGLTPPQYMEAILGKWIGRFVLILFTSFTFVDLTLLLLESGDFMISQVMPETPIYAIMLLFIFIIMIAVRLGMETLARTAEIVFPFMLLLLLILLGLLIPKIEFDNIRPILAKGIKPVIEASTVQLGFWLEAIILLFLYPMINQKSKATRSFYVGVSIGSLLLFMVTSFTILILGDQTTTRVAYPTFTMGKAINIGNFLERFEIVIPIIWLTTLFIKSSISFYATCMGITHLLRLKDYKVVTVPIALLALVFARVFIPNRTYYDEFIYKYWLLYALTYAVLIPLLLLIVDRVRNKRKSR
ncbi:MULTISPECIES: GerAB/ArcD/ProY family transporter [unclassified Paenibacillus]|uniref:GerAB/ArcD/ProY family transporter n=1 Tax=unclassified Paenibacillus TaxID=185978 RepID=UPI00363E56CB